MIITLSGVPGSGKTTAAKLLAEKLGWPSYSVGGLRGDMALERGLTIDELNKLGETDDWTDTLVDEQQHQLGTTQDNFVIEGRLSWHFIPHSFKILLLCDPAAAATRVFEAKKHQTLDRSDEPTYATLEEARAVIDARTASDVKRYQTHYGLDYRDPSHYDLVLDTTHNTGPEQTVAQILAALPR
jgi:cytidylate kinase